MKKIYLSGKHDNEFALVDDDDFDEMSKYQWFWDRGYAGIRRGKKTIYMHRLINKTPTGKITDHINRNKLDNRKENLRTCGQGQSQRNIGISRRNKSGYVGVVWVKKDKRWKARSNINRDNSV